MLTEAMKLRAVEIADEAMTGLLSCHAVPLATTDEKFGLCNEAGEEVAHLADADRRITEAFAWLSTRGLAESRCDEEGEFIVLTPNID